MTVEIEGGCRCGRVRYRVALQGLPRAYACHCRDCQTWTGSAFSVQFILPEDQLEVTGEPALFELTSPDGTRTSRQRGCPVCFTRIYNTNTRRPGLAVVRAGTLDRSDELELFAHIWTKRKLAGFEIPAGVPAWEAAAPPSEFAAVLTGADSWSPRLRAVLQRGIKLDARFRSQPCRGPGVVVQVCLHHPKERQAGLGPGG